MHYVRKESFGSGLVADADALMREFNRATAAIDAIDQNNIKDGSVNYSTTADPASTTLFHRGTVRTVKDSTGGILYVEGGEIDFTGHRHKWAYADVSLEFTNTITAHFAFYASANIVITKNSTTGYGSTTMEIFINGEPSGDQTTVAGTATGTPKNHAFVFHEVFLPPGEIKVEVAAKIDVAATVTGATELNIAAIGLIR